MWEQAMNETRTSEKGDNVVDALTTGIATAAGTIRDLAGQAKSAALEAGNTVQDTSIKASKQIGDAATKVYRQSVQAREAISRNTAEQPLLALLIAGAIGYGIAYLIQRR
jgi:ElaB/YqjD/DUF883 family membrane-anchored ribosome-binding protein